MEVSSVEHDHSYNSTVHMTQIKLGSVEHY